MESELRITPRRHRNGRLPAHAERALVLAAKAGGSREREELIHNYTPLIASVARIYRGSSRVERAELMQEGVVGLLKALERYDASLDTPFWAYAGWWVRQAMQQLVSELTMPMVLSDRALRQLARVRHARRMFEQANGKEATSSDLADYTELPREHVERLLAAERRPRGIEEPVGSEDGNTTLGELLADPKAEDAYERVPRQMAAEELPQLLAQLNERERTIVRARYGLDGRVQTLRELAVSFGVSAERVRQIEEASLCKIRDLEAAGLKGSTRVLRTG